MSGPEPGTTPPPEAPPPSAAQEAPPPPPPTAWAAPPSGPVKDAGPAPGVSYADLGIRIVAYIVDVIVVGILFFIVGVIIIGVLASIGGFAGFVLGLVFLFAFNAAFSAIYFIYSWTNLRGSPGQRVLSLETVNAADGKTLTQAQAIRRWLVLFGPFVLLSALQLVVGSTLGGLFGLVSLAYLIYLLYTTYQDPKRQGFHDHYAETVVVKRGA
jgi:uncharacterized RDD family membrane protein YckC